MALDSQGSVDGLGSLDSTYQTKLAATFEPAPSEDSNRASDQTLHLLHLG